MGGWGRNRHQKTPTALPLQPANFSRYYHHVERAASRRKQAASKRIIFIYSGIQSNYGSLGSCMKSQKTNYGMLNLTHLFQRLTLDLGGYAQFV
jgi:hypothetical protein